MSLSHCNKLTLFLISTLSRTLTVENPARDEVASHWLRRKSQTELCTVVQHGNPQEIIPYSIALISQLNQVVCQYHTVSSWPEYYLKLIVINCFP